MTSKSLVAFCLSHQSLTQRIGLTVVEMRGVEPLSEDIAIQPSPSADDIFYFASQMPIDGRSSCYSVEFPSRPTEIGHKVSHILTVFPRL